MAVTVNNFAIYFDIRPTSQRQKAYFCYGYFNPVFFINIH